MNRRTKTKVKKGFRLAGFIFSRVILVLIFVVIAGIATMFVYNTVQKKAEAENLDANACYKIVEVDGCSINATVHGSSTKHTIVTISDIESDNLSVYASYIARKLSTKCQVVTIDRPGYGFSKDAFKERSAQNIVKEYRKVLQKLDIDPPYILMPVGYGSVYATVWEGLFPYEVEGMILISPTEIVADTYDGAVDNVDLKTKALDAVETLKCKIGFQRLTYAKTAKITSWFISSDEAAMIKALDINGMNSFAKTNELRAAGDNYKQALGLMKKTETPKMCIYSENSFDNSKEVDAYFDYLERSTPKGVEKEEELNSTAASYISKSKKYMTDVAQPFADKLGNCTIVSMAGDKYIYEQRLQDLTAAVNGYLNYLDKTTKKIYSKYYDTTDVKWKEKTVVSGYSIITLDKNTAALDTAWKTTDGGESAKDALSKLVQKVETSAKSSSEKSTRKGTSERAARQTTEKTTARKK